MHFEFQTINRMLPQVTIDNKQPIHLPILLRTLVDCINCRDDVQVSFKRTVYNYSSHELHAYIWHAVGIVRLASRIHWVCILQIRSISGDVFQMPLSPACTVERIISLFS